MENVTKTSSFKLILLTPIFILMITCVLILFGYCGLAGFVNHGEISHFISATSVLAIPGIMIALWPTRKWVKEQLNEFKAMAATGALHQ